MLGGQWSKLISYCGLESFNALIKKPIGGQICIRILL